MPCSANGVEGVTLSNFTAGTYPYTAAGLKGGSGGTIRYQAQSQVAVVSQRWRLVNDTSP